MRKKGKRTREKEQGCLSQGYKKLHLDKEETVVVHRQMTVYKGTRENLVLGV